MFYSQMLLSKKGALGVVWMAAHCHKRLKKDQVQQTNISSSIDKILADEVPVVAHRILAFLLLGVVRIYSKKVEYLFHDCQGVMNKLYGCRTEKRGRASSVSRKHYYSISLPKKFELDAFDLEDSEGQHSEGGNAVSDKLIPFADGHRKDGNAHVLLYKEGVPFSKPSTAYTPPTDVFSAQHKEKNLLMSLSRNLVISLSSVGILEGNSSRCGDHQDPVMLDEADGERMHSKPSPDDPRTNLDSQSKEIVAYQPNSISQSVLGAETLRGNHCFLEDRLDPMILNEDENDSLSNGNARTDRLLLPIQDMEIDPAASASTRGKDLVASFGVLNTSEFTLEHSPSFKMLGEAENGQDTECQNTRMSSQEDRFVESVDKAHAVTPESVNCQRKDKYALSVATPDAGVGTPEVANVQTPAPRERSKILKKQKTLFDPTIVLSNKVLKNWIEEDPSDLKRERRKVPTTRLQAWRASQLDHLHELFEPSVCDEYKRQSFKLCIPETRFEQLSSQQNGVPHEVVPDTGRSLVQTPHDTHLNSLRSHENGGAVADSDILDSTTLAERTERWPPSNEGLEFDLEANDKDSHERRDTCSARTRMTERYLNMNFLVKKRRNEEPVLNMSDLLQGKTKTECATLFYEILVLKTREFIEVQQTNAYDDILLKKL